MARSLPTRKSLAKSLAPSLRRDPRVVMHEPALLNFAGNTRAIPVVLSDLSVGGARIVVSFETMFGVNSGFDYGFDSLTAKQRSCVLRWHPVMGAPPIDFQAELFRRETPPRSRKSKPKLFWMALRFPNLNSQQSALIRALLKYHRS